MKKKWVVAAWSCLGVPLLASLLFKPAYVAPEGQTRACAWSLIAVDVRSTPTLLSDANNDHCAVAADGFQLDFRIFETSDPDRVINLKALKANYADASGATSTPAPALSPPSLLSLPYLLFGNRLPLTHYSAPDRQHGYFVSDLTGSLVVAGLWTSDHPLTPAGINDRTAIRLIPHGRAVLFALWIKLIYLVVTISCCLPLLFAWFNKSIVRAIDQWWNLRAAGGLVVYGLLVPLALLGFLWLALLFTGWSTGFLLASFSSTVVLLQIARELISDRGKKLSLHPEQSSDPEVFSNFSAATSSVELFNVEVPFQHSVEVEMWLPRPARCTRCATTYSVYVPAKATIETREQPSRGSTIPSETLSRLQIQALTTAPRLVNGCIRCGCALEGSAAAAVVKRDGLISAGFLPVLGAAVAAVAGVALARHNEAIVDVCKRLPVVGGLLGFVFDELSGPAAFVLMLPAIFLLWQTIAGLADRSAKAGAGPYRMSACQKDGLLFEDIAAQRDPICPRCSGPLLPLRRFKVQSAGAG